MMAWMDEVRKRVLLIAASILATRKLAQYAERESLQQYAPSQTQSNGGRNLGKNR